MTSVAIETAPRDISPIRTNSCRGSLISASGELTRSRYTSASAEQTRSRLTSASAEYTSKPFGFEKRTAFDAAKDLLKSRSDSFLLPSPATDDDPWKRAAPDFRPQVYAPKPPKRNSRDAVQPWKYGTIPGEYKFVRRPCTVTLPHVLNPRPPRDQPIVTHFDIPDAAEARMMIVKEGMFPAEPYVMPKPHDFRGYPPIQSLGLPEFETEYDRDPYNIHFLSKRLRTIPGGALVSSSRDISGPQMAPPLPSQPEWEARLIMPKDMWPNRPKDYTRYRRRNRDPQSALMDRIEDNLSTKWAKEKMERALVTGSALDT